jgi:sec-independent protein translocase protein TatC
VIEHLIELRQRLIYCVLAITVCAVGCLYFSNELFHGLAVPLLQQLPGDQTLIATGIVSPVFVPLKLSLYVAVMIAMPYILHQLWQFVAPGLYRTEKNFAWVLLFLSSILFYAGITFAYFVIFPLIFKFLLTSAPLGVTLMPDINDYFDFCIKLFLAFGVVFEVPVLTLLVINLGIVSKATLRAWRPYIIVAAFVIGMLITPPDVLSQVLVAVPMCLLFEAGLWFGKEPVTQKE